MRQMKRLAALLLAAAIIAATPLAALALPAGGYVPVKATQYSWNEKTSTWVQTSERTMSYKSDGRKTGNSSVSSSGTNTWTKFKWKGNYVTKTIYSDGDYMMFKYKSSKRKSITDFDASTGKNEVRTYKWKKNTGTMVTDDYTAKLTVNGKGQVVKHQYKYKNGDVTTTTYKYYGNGNRKSYTTKRSDGYTYTVKYNSKGYVVSENGKNSTHSWSYKYKYTTKKGKITQRLYTYQSSTGAAYKYKTVYTKWKKVSHVMNCDAYGYAMGLG